MRVFISRRLIQESIIAGSRWTRLWWLDSLSQLSSSPSWLSLLSRLLEPLNTGSSQLSCSAFDSLMFIQKASWYWSKTADFSKDHAKIQPYHHAPGVWQLHLWYSGRLWAEPWSLWHIHSPQWSSWGQCLLFPLHWKWEGKLWEMKWASVINVVMSF